MLASACLVPRCIGLTKRHVYAVQTLTCAEYDVHYNSNRLGIRLTGPRPQFARSDGGEGGSHPSNVHDHVYALGTINMSGEPCWTFLPGSIHRGMLLTSYWLELSCCVQRHARPEHCAEVQLKCSEISELCRA
jgi:hypothetical protein